MKLRDFAVVNSCSFVKKIDQNIPCEWLKIVNLSFWFYNKVWSKHSITTTIFYCFL